MKYTFFLIAILVTGLFLPQEIEAQRHRQSKAKVAKKVSAKKSRRSPIRRIVAVFKKSRKKSVPSVATVANPLVGAMLQSGTATVVPRCTEDSANLTFSIYSVGLFEQPIRYENGELLALRPDAEKISPDPLPNTLSSTMPKKDLRWGPNFTKPKDLQLAQDFLKELSPTEMQFYPKLAHTSVSTIVLIKKQWYREDVTKGYEIIKTHFGAGVSTNFISECMALPAEKNPIAS